MPRTLIFACALLFAASPLHAQSTAAEWQAEAVRRYPDLGLAGSPLNKRFVEQMAAARKTRPELFSDPRWPLVLAEELADGPAPAPPPAATEALPEAPGPAVAPVGQILEMALREHDLARVVKEALAFAHPSAVYRAKMAELAQSLTRAEAARGVAEKARRALDPELDRVRKNASMADHVNPLDPRDKSGMERAAKMRAEAKALEDNANAAVKTAEEDVRAILAEFDDTLRMVRQSDRDEVLKRTAQQQKQAQDSANMRTESERLAATSKFLELIDEPEGRPDYANDKISPTYDETMDFINTKLLHQGWSLRFGSRSKKFLLMNPRGAFFLEPAHLSPSVKSLETSAPPSVQLEVARRDVTIRAIDQSGANADQVRKVDIPCADNIDSAKVAKAFRHLILMAGGKEDLF